MTMCIDSYVSNIERNTPDMHHVTSCRNKGKRSRANSTPRLDRNTPKLLGQFYGQAQSVLILDQCVAGGYTHRSSKYYIDYELIGHSANARAATMTAMIAEERKAIELRLDAPLFGGTVMLPGGMPVCMRH